jgi:hypothetical protein
MRQCGECQLCCKLLPMKAGADERLREGGQTIAAAIELGLLTARDAANTVEDFDKPAGQRCPHQRHHKGCNIYSTRPFGCRFWNCRWLAEDDTADLPRPDRSHYVIDVSPDFVRDGDRTVPVIQVWLDPKYPNAHYDPALQAFLLRRAHEGYAALIRLDSMKAFLLAAPPFNSDGKWHEIHSKTVEREHTPEDKIKALGRFKVTLRA